MSVFFSHVAMNRVTVKKPAAVRDILEEYDTRPALDVVGGDLETGQLVLETEVCPSDNDWPSAVREDELPPFVDGNDEEFDDWYEAASELHHAKGEQCLSELLLKLAPYLIDPLTLQAANFSSAGEFLTAKEWLVQPGATAVECREIEGFDNEAVPAVDKFAA
jgi:hypothetical protein